MIIEISKIKRIFCGNKLDFNIKNILSYLFIKIDTYKFCEIIQYMSKTFKWHIYSPIFSFNFPIYAGNHIFMNQSMHRRLKIKFVIGINFSLLIKINFMKIV